MQAVQLLVLGEQFAKQLNVLFEKCARISRTGNRTGNRPIALQPKRWKFHFSVVSESYSTIMESFTLFASETKQAYWAHCFVFFWSCFIPLGGWQFTLRARQLVCIDIVLLNGCVFRAERVSFITAVSEKWDFFFNRKKQ